MKKIVKTFFITLLIASCLFTGTFVGCKNPFMENIVPEVNVEIPEVNAEIPTIQNALSDITVSSGEIVSVSIEAFVKDGGNLSYQWLKSDSFDGEYSVIEGENNTNYSPDTSVTGTTYYKCVVTNTLNGKTASADSAIFTVTVNDTEALAPTVTGTTEYTTGVNISKTLMIEAKSLDGGILSYKWSKSTDNVSFEEITDETSSSLIIKPTENGTFYYKCEVTNTVEIDNKTKTATSEIIITVKVTNANGNIDIDFN